MWNQAFFGRYKMYRKKRRDLSDDLSEIMDQIKYWERRRKVKLEEIEQSKIQFRLTTPFKKEE